MTVNPNEEWNLLDEKIPESNKGKSGKNNVIQVQGVRPIKKRHIRFFLALTMILIVGTMAIMGSISWFRQPSNEMQDLVVLMSPIMTLAASVFTFYFTDTGNKK